MASAIQNAHEHLKTAELLFENQRFAHCVYSSVLAMEEAGKMPLIMDIMLSGEPSERWKEYIRHSAKTRFVNYGVTLQVKAHLPHMPEGFAEAIGNMGPTPDILEKTKQLAIYTDCLAVKGRCHIHDPATVDWKEIAIYVRDDARVVVRSLRVKSAAELSIWLKHAKKCRHEGKDFTAELPTLELALRKAGFIKEGWWTYILAENGQVALE